jgi:hypothetical protein
MQCGATPDVRCVDDAAIYLLPVLEAAAMLRQVLVLGARMAGRLVSRECCGFGCKLRSS